MASVTVLDRAMRESQWTKAEAIRWSESLKSRTSRRFRLEKSRAGNSRLVSAWKAGELKSKYGGEVVELIPRPPPRMSPKRKAALKLGPCPKCNASAKEPCKRPSGDICYPHRKRNDPTDTPTS
jgi:hypothetical protein